MKRITGQFVDILNREIYPAEIIITAGIIDRITKVAQADNQYLLPGFIDAHIHIESSMLVPAEFAKIAVTHGTVATVSDPHEIANVCGIAGVEFMIDNAKQSPLKFNFGAPSCVPATPFETAGANLNAGDIDFLLKKPEIKYLAEMMNFPGVLAGDSLVMSKISVAQKHNKPVDGHAPGLRGAAAKQYIAAGISTDHECFTAEEAIDKLEEGMLILIREGSAAKNFDALIGLMKQYPSRMMFCSDDKHPDELAKGHINLLVKRALAYGINLFDVLHAACVLPVLHYKLDIGLLREGDPADFILVNDLESFRVNATFINGVEVFDGQKALFTTLPPDPINNFNIGFMDPEDFLIPSPIDSTTVSCKVIDALNGQIITGTSIAAMPVANGNLLSDTTQDIIKICVVNRYNAAPVAKAFVRNFGIKSGALASSVAHDSHNIVVAGVDDISICKAVNAIIEHKGGISFYDGKASTIMPLPVAGLMTTAGAQDTARQYEAIDLAVKEAGCTLDAPFMTLSFLALPVIPTLKLTDKGLFDIDRFDFTSLITQS